MESYYTCSYIITYVHSKRNLNILKHNINHLLNDPRIEIIVVEAGKNAMLKNMDLKCKYIFVESDRYNVGWMFNIGAKKASTKYLFFGENCILPKMEFIVNVVRNPTDHECVYAQSDIIQLDEDATNKKNYNYEMHGTPDKINGMHYYTFEGFNKVGMWDENIYGKDLYSFQDKKNNLLLKLGKVDDSKLIKFSLDTPPFSDGVRESATKHYDKISTLDQNKMLNYIRLQVRKFSNPHRFTKTEIMNP